jgi:hypothetical protein
MTKLLASFPRPAEHRGGAWHVLWTILCWATAFSAVLVTTAVLMR